MSLQPKILFHGSSISGIKVFKPQPHKAIKGKSIVFATTDKAYALAMIYGTGDELAVSFAINPKTNQREMYVDELAEDKLSLLENTGYLYEVDPKYFEPSPEGLENEYISYSEVPVISEITVQNIAAELKITPRVSLIKYKDVLESMSKRKKDSKTFIKHDPGRFIE